MAPFQREKNYGSVMDDPAPNGALRLARIGKSRMAQNICAIGLQEK
jgi:hypothetical protein